MPETPKTREELIEDFKVVLENSGEDPAIVKAMLRPERIAALSDEEIMEFTDRYANFNQKAASLQNDIKAYNAEVATEVEAAQKRIDTKGDALIQKYIDEEKKSRGGNQDQTPGPV